MPNRRKFIRNGAMLVTGTALTAAYNRSLAFFNSSGMPSDQVNIGAIGINGMGWANVKSALKIPGVRLRALCDVDSNVLNARRAELDNLQKDNSGVLLFSDYRKMLDNKDIDAVMIGTPDHWHALQMIHASEAGKHVYVEKPAGNSIGECRKMVAAQERYKNIVQVGQWQRSQQHFRDAVAFIRTGALGNIRTVKVWCYQGWMKPHAHQPDSAVPPGVDYAAWLGPARTRPFNKNRFHFNFRFFWDYAGGLMTDWGVHLMDYAILGMEAGMPKSVSSPGGNFAYPELQLETPDTLSAIYEYENFNLIWDHAMGIDNGLFGRDHGIAFIGNNGTLALDRGGWEVIEEKLSPNKASSPRRGSSENGLDKHWENFIQAIRSSDSSLLNCDIQTGAHIASVCQMGNIAYRANQRLFWDDKKNEFSDKRINRKYLTSPYYNGYKI